MSMCQQDTRCAELLLRLFGFGILYSTYLAAETNRTSKKIESKVYYSVNKKK